MLPKEPALPKSTAAMLALVDVTVPLFVTFAKVRTPVVEVTNVVAARVVRPVTSNVLPFISKCVDSEMVKNPPTTITPPAVTVPLLVLPAMMLL